MSDVASLSVALHLNSAVFKQQINDAYQSAGQASRRFNNQAKAQASELSAAVERTISAAKRVGQHGSGMSDMFSAPVKGAGRLNHVLHEVVAGSHVASSTIINSLIPAVHTLSDQLGSGAGGWKAQQDAARQATDEMKVAAEQQIALAQAEKVAAQGKADIAQKTLAAAQAQREQAIELDAYYAKQAEVNKLHGVTINYEEEHLKNERAILAANTAEAASLEKLKVAQAAVLAADEAETAGKAALTAATEAATAANTEFTLSQKLLSRGGGALSAAMGMLGGPVGIGLTALAAAGALVYSSFKNAEEQTKSLNSALLDLKTSSLVSADELKALNDKLGGTKESLDAVTSAARGGFSGQMLDDISALGTAYEKAGGKAQELVSMLSSLKGDPLAAMKKLNDDGIVLSDTMVNQIMVLRQRGEVAKADSIIMNAAIDAITRKLQGLGIEVDKTSDSAQKMGNNFGSVIYKANLSVFGSQINQTTGEVNHLANAFGGVSQKANVAWMNMYAVAKMRDVLSGKVSDLAGDLNVVHQKEQEAQQERLKNTADLDSYLNKGTSAAERRAAAIKKLNDSIYKVGSEEYTRALKGINDEYDKATRKHKTREPGESEGQRELEQAKQRNAVLEEQKNNTDALTESEKQLAAFNNKVTGFDQQHLTTGQKSLVNMQDQIRAQLQANIALEKEASLQKINNKYLEESKKWQEEVSAMQREQSLKTDRYNMSDRAAEEAESVITIQNRWAQRKRALDDEFKDHSTQQYQDRLADLQSAEQQELAITRRGYMDQLQAQTDYSAGFSRGTQNWVNASLDANTRMASFANQMFDGMADSLNTFCTTGKMNFKSFTVSILTDLSKIAMKIAMSRALTSLFGMAMPFSSVGLNDGTHGIPSYSPDTAMNANGGVYNSPSLSAYSGGVYNSPQVFAFAKGAGVFGEAGPEAIMPLTRSSDGKLGVRSVGRGNQPSSTLSPAAAPIVNINIENGNVSSSAPDGYASFGKDVGNYVNQQFQKLLNDSLRPGGTLWSATKGGR